jgi:non-heme chloroperoxidase
MLIISGEEDNTVPRAFSNATVKRQQRNKGETEFIEMSNRGHSLTIDSGCMR